MKKIFEKHGVLRCVGALMDVLAFILLIVAAFVNGETADMILKVVGMSFFTIGGVLISLAGKEHTLAKLLTTLVLAGIIGSWVFTAGSFSGSDFYDQGFNRIGLAHFGYILYYSIYFLLDKIPFLIILAGSYGVLANVKGYQKLTDVLADKLSKHPIVASVGITVFLFLITTLFSQTLVVLLFVPFFVTILSKMGMDKLTVFAVTFGSVLVGILGCTYGTDSLASFNGQLGQTFETGLNYRYIVCAVAIVLYNFFVAMRVKKITKDTKKNVKSDADMFKVAKVKANEKVTIIPAIIVLAISAIIIILGYVDWNGNFGIEIFNDFHTILTDYKVGDILNKIGIFGGLQEKLAALEDGNGFQLISYILGGSEAGAFGAFSYSFVILILSMVVSGLLAFLHKMSFKEYVESFYNGCKVMLKPLLFLVFANAVFATAYISGSPINSMFNWLLNLVEGFNPFITSIVAFLTSLIHSDFGYVGYSIGGFVTAVFTDNFDIAHTVFTSMYGIVQVFMPTSAFLVIGLSMMKIDYKDWLKYIWLYAVGMIVILLVLFTVVTYI